MYQYKSNILHMEPESGFWWDYEISFNLEMFVYVCGVSVFTVCAWPEETQTVETGTVLCVWAGVSAVLTLKAAWTPLQSPLKYTHTHKHKCDANTSISSDANQLPFRTHRPNLKFTHHFSLLVMVAINFTLIQKPIEYPSWDLLTYEGIKPF